MEATQEQIDVFKKDQTQMMKDFVKAIDNREFQTLKDRLHRGNKNSLKLFTKITGLSTKTQKATNESIRALDPDKHDKWVETEKRAAEKAAAEKKKARDEKAKKDLLEGPVTYLGERMTFEKYIETLLQSGYTEVQTKGNGNLSTLQLVKHENNGKGRRLLSDVFRRKDERQYIQKMKTSCSG